MEKKIKLHARALRRGKSGVKRGVDLQGSEYTVKSHTLCSVLP